MTVRFSGGLMGRAALAATILVALSGPIAASAGECGPDALGTSRTITLARGSGGAFGTMQHPALPGLAKGEVVLTFDDGPVPGQTQKVLDALKAECAKATFFMVGNNLDANPDLARRVVAEGHSAGIHSYAHTNMGTLPDAAQVDDLTRTQASYARVFGAKAPAYRFPFLAETPTMMAALAKEGVAVFSVDFGITDWQPADTTPMLVERLVKELDAKGGGIILMHDANPPTATAIPELLRTLKAKGYKVVHVDWAG